MYLKSVLKKSSLIMVLGLISLTPLQTYADFINTVDNKVVEILKETESEESDESESEESDESESEEYDTYDDIELESEQCPDLEIKDDSFDKEVLEEEVDSVENKASEINSVEASERSNADVVLVSNVNRLVNAINTAPTDGTLRIIEADRNFNLTDVVNIPRNTNIMLRSDDVNQSHTLTQTGTGRHINIVSDATFTLGDGIILTSNRPNMIGGGVHVQLNAEFRMTGGKIYGNTVANNGGGVQVDGGTFIMEGGEISGNTANSAGGGGGGVNVSNGQFTMTDGEISGNTAIHSAGGVRVDGIFTMEGGSIRGNSSGNMGGGVSVNVNRQFTMIGGKISDNTSATIGGGVRVASGARFSMEGREISGGGEISGNRAASAGGVSVVGTFTMENGEISDNRATYSAGGVQVDGRFRMEGGTISENRAENNGGGVTVQQMGTFELMSGTIHDNKAAIDGGGIKIYGTFRMTSGTISENEAGSDGGGISLAGLGASADLTGPNIEIFDNEAMGYGGGIAADNVAATNNVANVHLNDIKIFENKAQYGGGIAGISNNTHAELIDVSIHNNTSSSGGGGIYLADINKITLTDTVIEGNDAVKGGGIYVSGNIRALIIDGGEITSNEANTVGGIYVSYDNAIDNVSISNSTYVADNMTTTNVRLFNNLYNATHNINANGRINPGPWDGSDDNHVFNTVDMNTSGFEVVVRLLYNFEGSYASIFQQIEFDVTDLVEFSSEFWDKYIAENIPTRLGNTFIGWSFTPEGEIIDKTQLGNEVILEDLYLYAQWELDQTYLNVSLPTEVLFQSNHVDATQLESRSYTIRNESIMGVHVDVANFKATNATGIDLIEELNIHSTLRGSTPIRLITNGSIELIPTNIRLLALPGLTDGSFEFSGQTNTSTQVENPSFELLLRFEVANVPSITVR